MSADNGIYVLKTKDGYRVEHLQAIENLYWWYVCCKKPKIRDCIINYICQNCKTINPVLERKNEICPDRLKEMFGKCKVYKTQINAIKKAEKIFNEVLHDDYCPIVEYGIQFINYDKEFPK